MKGRIRGLPSICLWLALTISGSRAYACPDDQYEECFFGACVCLPKIGGSVGAATEHIKHELQAQTGGPALEAWLIGSRNSAIGTSQTIPPQIRQALTGYIEDDVMNRARFKVGDNGILNLAGLSISYGDFFTGNQPHAVTLIDLIVFRDANDAFYNASLWAHELAHVKQFRDWGTRDFAIRYVRDPGGVENPAYDVGNNFSSWRAASQPTFPTSPFQPPARLGLASGSVMQGCGCWGFNPAPSAPEPRCQNGGVRISACAGFCPGGGTPYGYVCQ